MKHFYFIATLLFLATAGISQSNVIHVPADQPTIQDAIIAASDQDSVLVAEGTYYENINFLGKAITVASHFILDRDTSHISKTIINGSQSPWPDSASVVTMTSGEDTTSVLMGFTITGGTGTKWDGNSAFQLSNYLTGGGILIYGNGARIANNIIEKNHLTYLNGAYTYPDSLPWGAGILALVRNGHSLIIEENMIRDNHIEGDNLGCGAGILLAAGERALIDIHHNQILGNSIQTKQGLSGGGGIAYHLGEFNLGEHEILIRENIFSGNSVSSNWGYSGVTALGGAIFINEYKGDVNLKIYNNIITDNVSDQYGGGLGIELCELELYNNTIVNNMATEGGNSIFLRNFTTGPFPVSHVILHMYNNIIWSEVEGAEIRSDQDNIINSRHNSVKDGLDPVWDMHAEPKFEEGGYMLDASSSCVGAGANEVQIGETLYAAPKSDYFGNPRRVDAGIDLGAVESPHARTSSLNFRDLLQSGAGPCSHQLEFATEGGIPPFSFYLDDEDMGPPPWTTICNGDHVVKIIDGEGMEVTETLSFATGLSESMADRMKLSIYPNPTSGYFRMEFTLDEPGYLRIELMNVLGQVCEVVTEGDFLPGHQELDFSVAGMSRGVYILRLDGKHSLAKIIIQ